MKLRSLLFVPADSERKFAKANGIGADALILDLEDSVAPPRKALPSSPRLRSRSQPPNRLMSAMPMPRNSAPSSTPPPKAS